MYSTCLKRKKLKSVITSSFMWVPCRFDYMHMNYLLSYIKRFSVLFVFIHTLTISLLESPWFFPFILVFFNIIIIVFLLFWNKKTASKSLVNCEDSNGIPEQELTVNKLQGNLPHKKHNRIKRGGFNIKCTNERIETGPLSLIGWASPSLCSESKREREQIKDWCVCVCVCVCMCLCVGFWKREIHSHSVSFTSRCEW